MSGLIIALVASFVLASVALVIAIMAKDRPGRTDYDGPQTNRWRVSALAITAAFTALGVVLGFMAFLPQYRLYRATVEKRILVEQSRAEADAAVDLKRAEITRAEGVAKANEIISDSIDEQYIRWLYVNNLADHNASEIIYIPTEGGLPILEAGRLGDE